MCNTFAPGRFLSRRPAAPVFSLDLRALPAILNHMVKLLGQGLDSVFHALADPTRRRLLDRLRGGEASISSLARPYDMSLPAVSKHLAVLVDAHLVRREKRGRVHYCRVEPGGLGEASRWLEEQRRFWEDRLDALERYLESDTAEPGDKPPPRRGKARRRRPTRRPR